MRLALNSALLLLLAFVLVGAACARSSVSANLTWQGWDDKVGGWWNGSPDGLRDAHVTLTVSAPGDTLTALTMYPLDTNGSPLGPRAWDTTPRDGRWILGVVRGGVRLNPTKVRLCDPLGSAATTTYELYGEADGTTVEGRVLRIEVTFASGATAAATTVVGAIPAGALPAATINLPKPTTAPPDGTEQCASSDGSGGGTPPGGKPPVGTPPGSATLGRLTTSLAQPGLVAHKTIRVGTCTTVYTAYDATIPAGMTVALERRQTGKAAWTSLSRGGASLAAPACANKRGTASFRSTLRQGTKVLVTSNLVTIAWK